MVTTPYLLWALSGAWLRCTVQHTVLSLGFSTNQYPAKKQDFKPWDRDYMFADMLNVCGRSTTECW